MHDRSAVLRRLMRGVLPAAALAALALNGATAPAQAEEVKVGVVLTFSGGAAQFGEQISRGMELYMKEHPEAFGDNTVTLVKRDSKRPGGKIPRGKI